VTDADRASTRPASAPDVVGGVAPDGLPAPSPEGTSAPGPDGRLGPPPELRAAAAALFGARLPVAERYAGLLATTGVERGLIGPREAPRIWDRHMLNCGALTELIPSGLYVVDVGSGAGLPGIVLAVARPDLRVSLVESLARRTIFLTQAVDELGLDRVDVVRRRAEECVDVLGPADVVTARAVAPLGRLAAWCLPLVRPGGSILAIKGSSAGAEIEEHRDAVRRAGGGEPALLRCGSRWLPEPVTVVEVRRSSMASAGRGTRRGKAGSRRPAEISHDTRDERRARRGDGGDHPTI
jgi:16S rRNA (guanine527-N7)-methyltransferase